MNPLDIHNQVKQALDEDIGDGDKTADLIPVDTPATASVISRDQAVLCGSEWFSETFRILDADTEIEWQAGDGEDIAPGQTLCTLRGQARPLLSGERTALNFLQTLSATATAARRYAQRIADLPVRILDTRKTIPGLRDAQKYAVRCGGGFNHRRGLYDAMLVKENHIIACGSISAAIARARDIHPDIPLEVEVEDLVQLEEALAAGADALLLDNFSIAQLQQAVRINRHRARLEASGSITLDNLREVAETGIDFISIGALTKHVQAVDLSMRFQL